jgi:hypothetical protein
VLTQYSGSADGPSMASFRSKTNPEWTTSSLKCCDMDGGARYLCIASPACRNVRHDLHILAHACLFGNGGVYDVPSPIARKRNGVVFRPWIAFMASRP